jgi:hypothetical protein
MSINIFGWKPDTRGAEAFVSSLPHPTLAEAAPNFVADEKKDVFLGGHLLQVMPEWERLAQPIGSCVGWGAALSCDILAACDILLRKEPEVFGGRTLEASIYAFSRVEARGVSLNPGGDGSTGFHAAKAIRDFGTLHYRVDYNGKKFADVSGSLEKTWGRHGVPNDLEEFAKKRKVREVTLVKSFSQYAAAIQNGYPVFICSSRGFNMTMKEGWLSPSGTWMHCMMGCGVRWDRPGGFVPNSWGECYRGSVDSRLPRQFQRSGGWVDADVLDKMLAQEDSYAVAGYNGFEQTDMPDWTGGVL